MKPHQDRVIVEKRELDAKRERLLNFFQSEQCASLDEPERIRLHWQEKIMHAYSDILGERIGAFED